MAHFAPELVVYFSLELVVYFAPEYPMLLQIYKVLKVLFE